MQNKGPQVGEHPPRLTAPREEDPWHESWTRLSHPELWVGAANAKFARDRANLESVVRMTYRAAGRFG